MVRAAVTALLLAFVALLPVTVADSAHLQALQTRYATDADPRWTREAEALAREAQPEVRAQALVWLGGLAQQAGTLSLARERFAAARLEARSASTAAFAARGLADVDLALHRYRDALRELDEALAQHEPSLAFELGEKRGRVVRQLTLAALEYLAWGVYVLCFVRCARLWRGAAIELPLETRALAPVYALLVVAAWGRDPAVPYAILSIALGSLALVTVAFAPRARRSRLDHGLLVIASGALLFASLHRAGILEAVWQTITFGSDMG